MKPIVMGFFAAFLAAALLIPSPANAQDARAAKSMKALKDQTAELGAPKIEGKEAVGGKDTPALYFGSTKMNNNLAVVDKVANEGGRRDGGDAVREERGRQIHPRSNDFADGAWKRTGRPGFRLDQRG